MDIPEIEAMDTLRKARDACLMKWRRVRELRAELWDLIDQVCGLCQHAKGKAQADGTSPGLKCDYCRSSEFCDKLMKEFNDCEEVIDELIDRVLTYLVDLEVTD